MSENSIETVRPEIIGIVRFSVLTETGLKGWRATRDVSLEDAAARIFDDERLALRFELFRITTLAGFAREWEHGARFRLLVLVSPLMPARWRQQLENDVRDMPFVELVDVPFESSIGYTIKRHVLDLSLGDRTVLTFRIDDDDCLQTGMIERLAAYATPAYEGSVISFVNGVYCSARGGRLTATDKTYRSIALGISYVVNAREFQSIFSLGSHTKLDQVRPFVADDLPRAWLRSMHGAADTAGRHELSGDVVAGAAAERVLAEAFPYLDAERLKAAYLAATRPSAAVAA